MKNTFKKLLLCFMAVSAVVMSSAAVIGTGTQEAPPPDTVDVAAAPEAGYVLRDWQGYIAVFEASGEVPKQITDIPTDTLNSVDREKLRRGVNAESREALLKLMEDFSS